MTGLAPGRLTRHRRACGECQHEGGAGVSKIKVLIVDDSITIRAVMEQIISGDPECEVVGIAPDVKTARELMRSEHPDVVTLDLAMPGVGGIQFLDELSGRRHAPILVVSSATKDKSEEAKEAIAHGAAACFDKSKVVSNAQRFLRALKAAAAPEEPSMWKDYFKDERKTK